MTCVAAVTGSGACPCKDREDVTKVPLGGATTLLSVIGLLYDVATFLKCAVRSHMCGYRRILLVAVQYES